jgi:hypothetical protein
VRWEKVEHPRRGTTYIKQFLPERFEMTADVKRVSNSLKGMMSAVKKEIDAAEQEVHAAQSETIQAVSMTREMVKGVRNDVAELRALLGGASNNPPKE